MISMEHVSRSFGPVKAVDDLCLEIPAGELFCFLGPNGAGKTTTIKMLCGLLRPSSGRIRVCGMEVGGKSVEWRRLAGYIPDTPFMYERLTVREFFEFSGELYNVPRREIENERAASFAMFGLDKLENALIKDLSHGFRQRLIYASTFLHKPKALFIDEPFVGLDPHSIRMIHDLLRNKAGQGITIFLTTHILAFAERLADRIGIIVDGRLKAAGTLSELRAQSAVSGHLEDVFMELTGAGAPAV